MHEKCYTFFFLLLLNFERITTEFVVWKWEHEYHFSDKLEKAYRITAGNGIEPFWSPKGAKACFYEVGQRQGPKLRSGTVPHDRQTAQKTGSLNVGWDGMVEVNYWPPITPLSLTNLTNPPTSTKTRKTQQHRRQKWSSFLLGHTAQFLFNHCGSKMLLRKGWKKSRFITFFFHLQ